MTANQWIPPPKYTKFDDATGFPEFDGYQQLMPEDYRTATKTHMLESFHFANTFSTVLNECSTVPKHSQ
jgi:hypothetical protein